MAQLAQINRFHYKKSENLLGLSSLFLETPTINYNGNGSLNIINGDALAFNMQAAELFTVQDVSYGIDESFDFGTALQVSALGKLFFQFSIFVNNVSANPGYTVDLSLEVYNGGVLFDTFTQSVDLTTLTEGDFYTFGQAFEVNSGGLLNFKFKILAKSVGTPNPNFTLTFSGFKLERNDKQLFYPSAYTHPDGLFTVDNGPSTGWQQIIDNTYTTGAPLAIANGVTGKILTGAITELNTQLPAGVSTFWDNSADKLVAVNEGDAFTLSLRFKARIDVNNGYFDVGIDIGAGAPFAPISLETCIFSRVANTEQSFDIDLSYFTGATFITNGGDIIVTPQNGNLEIYDIRLVIIRTHKGV